MKKLHKSVNATLDNSGLRKTRTNLELWRRRFKEVLMYNKKLSISKIAKINNISRETVYNDLKSYTELIQLTRKIGINREIFTLEEIIRRAFGEMGKTKNGYSEAKLLEIIINAVREKAILKGLRNVR